MHCVIMAAVPILLFIIGILAERSHQQLGISAGIAVGAVEGFLSLFTCIFLWPLLKDGKKYLMLVPLGLGIGDVVFAVFYYAFKISLNNFLFSLAFLIPMIVGIAVLAWGLWELLRSLKQSKIAVTSSVLLFSVATFFLHLIILLLPQSQTTALSGTAEMSVATIMSLLDSTIAGLAVTLLILMPSRTLQLPLLGILVMQAGRFAVRYEFLNLSFSFIYPEFIWCFGLVLVALGAYQARLRNFKDLKRELGESLPFYSVRGMTLMISMLGLCIFWLSVATIEASTEGAMNVSKSLLIITSLLGVSAVFTNFITARLSQLSLLISTGELDKLSDFSKALPKEISVIVSSLLGLNSAVLRERDRALQLSSKLAHDIRAPVGALSIVAENLNGDVELQKSRGDCLHLLNMACKSIKGLSETILTERKRLLEKEYLSRALKNAVAISQTIHPTKTIRLEAPSELSIDPRFIGVTPVLTNIINNAAEASSENQVVDVKLTEGVGKLLLEVSDSGSGIEPQLLKKLQAGEAISTKSNGHGIGVSSAIAWTRENRISLNIESSLAPSGTRVSFEFKLLQT